MCFLLNIGLGGGVLYASYRSPKVDFYASSWQIPLGISSFAITAAIVNFAYLGHVSENLNIPIDKLPISGIGWVLKRSHVRSLPLRLEYLAFSAILVYYFLLYDANSRNRYFGLNIKSLAIST